MRLLVILLALLAAAKVATVEWLRHAAADDLIVSAYKPRALEACGREARRRPLGVDAAAWTADTPVTLEIGDRRANVYVWQVNDPAWGERFRATYLHLTATGPAKPGAAEVQVLCSYSVLAGTAVVGRL